MSKADQVVVSYLDPGTVEGEFCQALVQMSIYDIMTSRRLAGVFRTRSGALIASARNGVVEQFLAADVADWLLFIDSDMVFEKESLERLFKSAHPESCPVIGGLCYGLDPDNGPFPVVYKLVNAPEGPMTWRPTALVDDQEPNSWPGQDTGLLEVDGTGAAFLMIHRSVLEAIRDRSGSKGWSQAYPWFQETELGRHPVGEDITFCLRARALGFPIFVDLDLRIGHKKDRIIAGAPPALETTEATA